MKFLVAGLGGIGQRHTRNIRTLLGAGAEVIAFRTRRQQHVLTDRLTIEPDAELEERYDIRAVGSLEEGLAESPDAVLVTNPTALHIDVAQKAADAGCAIFMEKPISHTWDGVERLLETVREKQIVTLVGYQLRWHPAFQLVRRVLDEGNLGDLLSARFWVGEYLPAWHTYEDYRQMYASRRDLGGGVILSQIHEMDLIYWYFGLPRSVYTLGGKLSDLEIDVEDTASSLIECRRDGRPLPVHLAQDYVQRPPSRGCEIVGTRGRLSVDLPGACAIVTDAASGKSERHEFSDFQRNELFLQEMRQFIAAVRGEERSPLTLKDGAQSLRMALAALESLDTGRVINL